MSPGLRDAIREAITEAVVHYGDPVRAAMAAYDAWESAERPVGRQRKHESAADRRLAYLEQQKAKRAAAYAATNETIRGACRATGQRDEFGRVIVVADVGKTVGRNGSAAKTQDISTGVGGAGSATP
jgi:hypothetical protein